MILKRLIIVAAMFLALAGIAHATRNPTPPPSGIVVHLFGPNSIMSNVVPGLPGETPRLAPGQTAAPSQNTGSGQSTAAGQAATTATTASDSVNTSANPSWGAIAHQLFVTGDPNDPPRPAAGRPGERLPASQ